MLVAMLIGMELLGPLWTPERVELSALWMAVSMSVPMALWMRYRGHGTLADVIRRVHAGSRWVDPALAADALAAPPCPLTRRELEVLRLSEFGTPVAEIASRTSLSAGTVRNHLSAVVAKLGAGSRTEAFQLAHDHGWL